MHVPAVREFRLSPSGHGVSCGANGVFVGSVPLLKRTRANGKEIWEPRDCEELSVELGSCFGLPIDVSSKAQGIAAAARTLNEGSVARAQLVTLHLRIPDPSPLAKARPLRAEVIAFVRGLAESNLIKADWDPTKHPRWPGGVPDSQGGRFAPKGSVPNEPGIGHNGGPPLETEAALPEEEDVAIALGPVAALAAVALAASTVPASGGEDEALERYHMHHPWPKYLGGAGEQTLTRLPAKLHMQYHGELDSEAPRRWGTEYYENMSSEDYADMIRRIMEFTKKFDSDHGTNLYEGMTKNEPPKR
jgi:hypothetical protein